MAKGKVTIIGLPHLKAVLKEKVIEMQAAAEEAVKLEIDDIQKEAVLRAPKDKGDLERKIQDRMTGRSSGEVRSSSDHAAYVEFGSGHGSAQPHMRPAAMTGKRRFPRRAAEMIKKAIGG